MSLIITYTAWNIETINQFLLPNIYWKTLGLWNTDEAIDSFCCLGDVEENRATRTAIIYSGLRHWMVEFFSCDIDLHIIYICKRHLLAPSPRKKCLLMLAPFKNVLRHFIKLWTTIQPTSCQKCENSWDTWVTQIIREKFSVADLWLAIISSLTNQTLCCVGNLM